VAREPRGGYLGSVHRGGSRNPSSLSVLVIDDEKNIRTTLTVCLESMGCRVSSVATPDAALTAVEHEPFDLAFLDVRLGAESGLDLVPRLLALRLELAIVVITAFATIDTAVEAIRRGAIDYLPKPFTPAQIRQIVERILAQRSMARRVRDLEQFLSEEVPEIDPSSAAPSMRAVLEMLERAAHSDAPVLLRGESGTGKGVLARTLHSASPRAHRSFITVNCPTLSSELLASELFGHAEGAFTGAVRDQAGRVEAAEGGSLFLDEIGEISPALQAKLLRFLQEKQFERIGESKTRRADVRIVCATNRDLETDVREGRFREDLLFRLNVIEVRVPALRDRSDDILPLALRFLAFFAKASGRSTPELSKTASAMLLQYPWPGNVRELRNAMERAVILWPAQVIEPEALPMRLVERASSGPSIGGDFTLEELEKEHILRVLRRAPTIEDATRILGIDASTLWRKRKRYEGT
jgi:two-component system, NtrC family, response regulator AlgB